MPTPRPNCMSVASGQDVYAGKAPPAVVPTWTLAFTAPNQIAQIAGTSGAGGSSVDNFCGWAVSLSRQEVFIAGAGGHNDSYDNRVVSLDLKQNSPAWVIRKASSSIGQLNSGQPYNFDGTPNAVHYYNWERWVENLGRVMRLGCYLPYTSQNTLPNIDGFLPSGASGGAWDPAGTWPLTNPGFYGNAQRGQNGGTGDIYAIWGSAGVRKMDQNTGAWSAVSVTNLQNTNIYYPWAYCVTGDYAFGLSRGDGFGGGGSTHAVKHTFGATQRQDPITINASAAYTAWQNENRIDASMEWNPLDGCFYWWAGTTNVYKIIPNAGLAWDMVLYAPSNAAMPTDASGAGIQNRFSWMEVGNIKGFLMLTRASSNCHFLRMN